ncbi:TRAP transporter large permease [Mesorhizobium marinum]|uniref:TRAP transporter large permease protein n=1 Tax=Mesorhizobium marinum TaxID=3228790 RepID=A0ABV3QX70_9HYPH
MTAFIFVATLLGGIALGFPIAYALLLTGVALMLHIGFFDAQIVAQNLMNGADSFPLMAIPFFMLTGAVMNRGGLSRRIVELALAGLGHVRGGLGYVTILAGLVMASFSGSAAADAAALAAILIPMMLTAGHDARSSSGLVASTAIIALVIPPSIGFILIGVVGNISITRLFLGGIVPGLVMALALTIVWYVLNRGALNLAVRERAPRGLVWARFRESFWALFLPVIIVVGLRFGVFTPTEAGVVASVYAIFIAMFVYRELDLSGLHAALLEAGKLTATVMFLVATAAVSGWMVTVAGLQAQVAQLVAPLAAEPQLFMLVVVGLVIVIGMAMDMVPIILILVPVLLPVAVSAGVDPVYFGVIFLIACSIGLITPPVGTVLNVVAGVSRIPFMQVVRGVWPYVVTLILALGLMIAFPAMVIAPARFLAG